MKLLKFGMRFWILVSSLSSFLVGWAMLAHAPKPVQPVSAAPVPTLAPLQPLRFNNDDEVFGNGNNTGPRIIPRTSFVPSFRTGGS